MQDKIFIMNFKNEKVGSVTRMADKFITEYQGELTESTTLPRIMCGIAPEPSQFPSANDVLEYFHMKRLDVWKYLARSNGFKNSRKVWFMAEPIGEVWIPLILGMQKYSSYRILGLKIGDACEVLNSGRVYVNRHQADILPECVFSYLKPRGASWRSTTTGYVKDIIELPAIKGLVGRVILNFPE